MELKLIAFLLQAMLRVKAKFEGITLEEALKDFSSSSTCFTIMQNERCFCLLTAS